MMAGSIDFVEAGLTYQPSRPAFSSVVGNIDGPRDQRVVTTSLSFDYLEGSCQTVLMIPSTLSQTRRLMPCLRETIVS